MAIVQIPSFYDASNFSSLDLIPFWRTSDGSMFNITYDELYVQLESSLGTSPLVAWNGITITDNSIGLGGTLNDGITSFDSVAPDGAGINYGVTNRLSEFQIDAAATTLTVDELIVSGLNTTTGDTPYVLVMDVVDSSIAYRQLGSMAWNTGTDYVLKAGDTMTGPLTISGGGLVVSNDVSITGDLLVSGAATFAGDVNIDGSLFVTSVQTIDVSGRFIVLNTGQTGVPPSTMQSGIVIDRGDLDPYVFIFDESTEDFRVGIAPVDSSQSFNDASTQAVATREDTPISGGFAFWNSTLDRFDTSALTVGDVFKVGTPVNDQIAVWTGDGTLEGTVNLTIDSGGQISITVQPTLDAGFATSRILTRDAAGDLNTLAASGGDASLFLNAAGAFATPAGTGGGGTDVSVFWQEDVSDNTTVILIDPSQNVQLSSIEVEEDGGTVQLVNMPVSTAPTLGTQESYTFDMDGSVALKIYGRASGSGALTETAVVIEATYQYMGDPNTNGSWRFYVDGSANLTFEKRVAGIWQFGGQFT